MNREAYLIIGISVGVVIGILGGSTFFPPSNGETVNQELEEELDALSEELANLKYQVDSMTFTSGSYDEFIAEVEWYRSHNNSIVNIIGDVMVDEYTGVAYSHYLPFNSWISMMVYVEKVTEIQLSKQDLRLKAKDMRDILDEMSDDPALGEPRIFIDPLGKYLGFIYYEPDWETSQICWTHIE